MNFVSEKVGNQIVVRHATAPIVLKPMSLDEWIAFRHRQAQDAIETAKFKARRDYGGDTDEDFARYETDEEVRSRLDRFMKELNWAVEDIIRDRERDIEDMQKCFAEAASE